MRGNVIMNSRTRLLLGAISIALVSVPVYANTAAPSSLAIALANEYDMTLIGFLRGSKFNIYTGENRIT